MKIFIRAFFKEFTGNFVLGLALFTIFFFFGESSRLLEMALLVAGGEAWVFFPSLAKLYWRYWLSVSGLILPMAVLLGGALTLSRLQEDRELLAFETLGININRWMYAILGITGVLFLAIQIPLVERHMPKSRYKLKRFAYDSRSMTENFRVEPGSWLDLGSARLLAESAEGPDLKNVTLYVGKKAQENSGKNSSMYRVTGKTADYEILQENPQNAHLRIRFYSGSLALPASEKPGDISHCDFETYENYIPLAYPAGFGRSWREHTGKELLKMVRKPQEYEYTDRQKEEIKFEFQSRASLALSIPILILIATYACQRFGRLTKGFGFGLALALLAAYWIVMVGCTSVGLPWLTNIAYAALTLPILRFI